MRGGAGGNRGRRWRDSRGGAGGLGVGEKLVGDDLHWTVSRFLAGARSSEFRRGDLGMSIGGMLVLWAEFRIRCSCRFFVRIGGAVVGGRTGVHQWV